MSTVSMVQCEHAPEQQHGKMEPEPSAALQDAAVGTLEHHTCCKDLSCQGGNLYCGCAERPRDNIVPSKERPQGHYATPRGRTPLQQHLDFFDV